ncbi:MAG: hypothetical protein KC549_05365 [Myxococcales bacterium]|nr:hypothetical protein [Myxococcales bacterium]MCB9548647.1 hypothetical protein [Myxococcales bacterium]
MRALLAGLLALLPLAARADDRTLRVQLGPGVAGPAAPIPLYFDQRLTIVLPDAVRLAVAGSADVLVAHTQDNVVVATLIDSEYVRAVKPRTNLTVLTEAGAAFTCTIAVAEAADAVAVNLIEVQRAPDHAQRVGAEAKAALAAWLADPGTADPDVARALAAMTPEVEKQATRQIAAWAADGGFEVLAGVQRTRQGFIYLTSHGLLRLGDAAVLRLTAANHSQPALTLGSVRVFAGGQAVPAGQVVTTVRDAALLPDGQPRAVGVLFPAAALRDQVAVEVCEAGAEPRCVRLDVR